MSDAPQALEPPSLGDDPRGRALGRFLVALVLGGLTARADHGQFIVLLLTTVPLVGLELVVDRRAWTLPLVALVVLVVAGAAVPLASLQAAYTKAMLEGSSPRDALEAVASKGTSWTPLNANGIVLMGGVFGTAVASVFSVRATTTRVSGKLRLLCGFGVLLIGGVATVALAGAVAPFPNDDGTRLIMAIAVPIAASSAAAFLLAGIVVADFVGGVIVAEVTRARGAG